MEKKEKKHGNVAKHKDKNIFHFNWSTLSSYFVFTFFIWIFEEEANKSNQHKQTLTNIQMIERKIG